MSYCVNCGVELEPSLKECPLCNTPVINPNQISSAVSNPYPSSKGQVEIASKKDFGILLTVVLSATSVTCLLLNLLVFQGHLWSFAVIGACICLFFLAAPAVFYTKASIYFILLLDGAAVVIYLYLLSYLTTSSEWLWQLGMPIVVMSTALIEIFAFLAHKFPFNILSASLYLFVEIPILCVTLELLIRRFCQSSYNITWSAVVLTVCVIIDIALITILAKKRLRNEVNRRLHF
ncbi:MAG: hypothetical protein HDR12_05690 [Lachnospiraceae bacterium]|nr:hypothetical protein [Lachnospiraceae bacterium]